MCLNILMVAGAEHKVWNEVFFCQSWTIDSCLLCFVTEVNKSDGAVIGKKKKKNISALSGLYHTWLITTLQQCSRIDEYDNVCTAINC